jgi:glycosyltransferase involved in cell wall biosynthesis
VTDRATPEVLQAARARLGSRDAVLVHDYLLVMRGAERTFAKMCDLFPGAPVATLLYDRDVFHERLAGHDVRTSPLQRLGLRQANFRALFPMMPWAAGRLPVGGHDLVVSSSSAFAHGVRPDPEAVHVCLCHTPFRYVWSERENAMHMIPRPLRPLGSRLLNRIERWDLEVSRRPTRYLSVGRLSQSYIRDFWGIDTPIVRQPVELDRFAPAAEREDYALVVGELVRHKRIDQALEAARRAGVPIKVVGDGADGERLRALYADSAEFLGRVDDERLAELYARARVLIMTAVEEFGLTAVEAQASGCPVLAGAAGGVLETVVDGETGVLVPEGNVEAFAEVLSDDALDRFSTEAMVANAQRFSIAAFYEDLIDQILIATG